METMNKFWVITKEVYKKTVKSFGFLAVVLSPILMIAVIVGIGWFISRDTTEDQPIAVVSEEAFVQETFAQEGLPFEVDESIGTVEEAEEALVEEEISGYLEVSLEENTIQAEMVHEGSLNEYEPVFNEVLTNLQTMMLAQELGISGEDIAALSEPVLIEEELVSIEDGAIAEDEEGMDTFLAQGSAYIVCIAIFMFIMTYASIIAEEVANEKGTRIMEIILSSATATQHFFGKLAGVMLIMLTQIVLYVVVGGIAYFFLRDQDFVQDMLLGIDLTEMLQGLMGYSLIFFIVGVLMYVVLAAFFGSLTTKVEDVSKSVQPLVYVSLVGFYIGMFALSAPDNIVSVVGSYIPIFTPFVMPFRIAAQSVGDLGIWLSVAGTIVTAALITIFSLAFYRSNVLVYSDTNIFGTMKRSWSVMQSNRKARKQQNL